MSGRFSIIPARAVDDPELGLAALRVLNLLGTYGDKAGWCFPAMTTMAERLGVTRQAVQQQVNQLVKLGYLEKRERFNVNNGKPKGQTSNLYRILFDVGDPEPEQGVQDHNLQGVQGHNLQGVQGNGLAQMPHITPQSTNDSLPTEQAGTPPLEEKKKSAYQQNSEELEAFFAEAAEVSLPKWKKGEQEKANGGGLQVTWRTPLNNLLKLCGGDIDATKELIRKAIEQMDEEGLTFTQPCSIEKNAISIKAREKRKRRRDYSGQNNLTVKRIAEENKISYEQAEELLRSSDQQAKQP